MIDLLVGIICDSPTNLHCAIVGQHKFSNEQDVLSLSASAGTLAGIGNQLALLSSESHDVYCTGSSIHCACIHLQTMVTRGSAMSDYVLHPTVKGICPICRARSFVVYTLPRHREAFLLGGMH